MPQTRYIQCVLELLRKNFRFFLGIGLAGLALRLLFVFRFPAVVDDSRLYANIAQNWLQHGIYGITDSGQIMPTLSRLPGYPGFLAAVFAVFGANNFRAVLLLQVLFDLGTCLLIADLARRMFSERAAKAAFALAALCPFLANYAAAALTETLEIFFTALALDLIVQELQRIAASSTLDSGHSERARSVSEEPAFARSLSPGQFKPVMWLAGGLSIGACILLRPDGGILLAAAGVYFAWLFLRPEQTSGFSCERLALLRAGVVVVTGALIPLIPWTARNFHTFHRFQPLAPRYAYDVDELVMKGFNQWTRTWIAEYTSTQEIYWMVPGEAINITRLPHRAFDSPQQRRETEQLFADYNQNHELTPDTDGRFGALARERIRDSRFRYYLWLPALRVADMWLRPRVEMLPSDPRWWEFNDEPVWLSASIVFGLINLAYIALATMGFLRARHVAGIGLLFLFLALRSLFLGSLENPEPRYTLECYPVVIVAAAALWRRQKQPCPRESR
ncbi:MAG TPA: glycosyltransferase family 39 protein [Candidatus Binatia bacterium]|nr:glycosyltransferase family 39 protein [Candidatus Binatia bacterium]